MLNRISYTESYYKGFPLYKARPKCVNSLRPSDTIWWHQTIIWYLVRQGNITFGYTVVISGLKSDHFWAGKFLFFAGFLLAQVKGWGGLPSG